VVRGAKRPGSVEGGVKCGTPHGVS